jgi:hypothetical protein
VLLHQGHPRQALRQDDEEKEKGGEEEEVSS